MRLRLIAFLVAVFALAPASAHAALTAGGPWVPNIGGFAAIDDATWLAVGGMQVSRTADGGRTWRTVVPFDAKGPKAPLTTTAVAAAGGIAYAAGYPNLVDGALPSGVVSFGVSLDKGSTWSWSWIERSVGGWTLIADPSNSSRVALFASEVPASGTSPATPRAVVLVSQDRGASWQNATAPPASARNIFVARDGTLYAGAYRSSDWAASWQPLSTSDSAGEVLRLYETPAPYGDGGLVTTATNSTPAGIELFLVFSSDRGATWTRVPTAITSPVGTNSEYTVAAGPDGQIVVMRSRDGKVFIFRPDGSTVAEFPDRPLTGTVQGAVVGAETVIPTNGGVVVVSTAGVENRSTGIASYGGLDSLSVNPRSTGGMLASTQTGLYRSADGGQAWAYAGAIGVARFGPTGTAVGLRQEEERDSSGTVTAVQRVVTSSDGGATWSSGPVAGTAYEGASISWAGSSGGYLLQGCSLLRSTDGWASLAGVTHPSPNDCMGGQVAAGRDSADVVALVHNYGSTRAWISVDGGTGWRDISAVVRQLTRFGTSTSGSVSLGLGAKPPISFWMPGAWATCWSTDLGAKFQCAEVPEFRIPKSGYSTRAGVVSLEYQADGALVATIGDNPASANPAPQTIIVRSFDNGKTWAVTGDLAEFTATEAIDITTGKAARQGGKKKKSAAGKRRFALASVGVVRQTLDFAVLAVPSVRTAGIKVSRAGGGKVTVPLVCKAKHRCSGRVEGQMRIGGKNVTLASTRFSILGSKNVSVRIAKKSQATFKTVRGAGTIRLQVRYTDPTGKKRNPIVTANGPVTVR